jgi:hypothetical protein
MFILLFLSTTHSTQYKKWNLSSSITSFFPGSWFSSLNKNKTFIKRVNYNMVVCISSERGSWKEGHNIKKK